MNKLKYARDYLRKKEEKVLSNTARQVIRIAIDVLNEKIKEEEKKLKKYAWIKQESDAETYLINNTYYKVVWGYSTGNETGWHNEFDANVCVFKWVGEPCTLDELPKVFGNDWEPIKGFDVETIENSYGNLEVDWKDYSKKVDEILAEIEEEAKK